MNLGRWCLVLALVSCGPPRSPAPIVNTARDQTPVVLAPEPPLGRELVHFDPGSSTLRRSEHVVLDRVLRLMKTNPAQLFQISGHTDPSEPDVSEARAIAVRDYLVSHGIEDRRLLLRAAGTAEPRADDSRRVDFQRATVKTDISGRRVVITGSDVEILDAVRFVPGKGVRLASTSFPVLDAVVATMQGTPSILLLEVQSHVDERGDDAANLNLTNARADVVRDYLIAKGVDAGRLTAQGYGETQPLDLGHTATAWEKNNRVAFLIIKRQP